jgi:membrane-bound serine protease (ClpP class)
MRLGVAGALIFLGALSSVSSAQAAPRAEVVELELDQVVQPLSASYVVEGIHRAERDHAAAVLLRIDTPGGLDSSMRKIVGALLGSRVPVVCWVGPSGARAASAGTFILLACNVATMAPGTNVGAAHPVGLRGEVLSDKITNDAVAFIRSIAETRDRNADWAEQAVRRSVAVSAQEARKLDVIDGVALSEADALRFADGERTRTASGKVMIDSWPADVDRRPIAFGRGLFGSLVDPNLAFLLFLIGIAGLIMEALHPGLSVPGVVGALSLIFSLVMFEMLPVNIAGVILLVAGIAFLVVELHVPGFGVPGIAGTAALVLGGLLLFDAGALVRVSRPMLIGAVIGIAAFVLLVIGKVVRARRMPPPIPLTVVGEIGVVTTDLDPVGTVRVRSEDWTAESPAGVIPAGTRIRVVEENGLKLRVDRYVEEGAWEG